MEVKYATLLWDERLLPCAEMKLQKDYSSGAIRAGALLPESRQLLSGSEASFSIGRRSAKWTASLQRILRSRFDLEPGALRSLQQLTASNLDALVIRKIIYYHAARADKLLYDFIADVVYSAFVSGRREINVEMASRFVERIQVAGESSNRWSSKVRARVARGLLSVGRDFGVFEGKAHKRIASPHMPLEAFVYVAFYLKHHIRSAKRLMEHRDWRLFLIGEQQLHELFIQGHQAGFWHYAAAGSLVRLDWRLKTWEEMTHGVLAGTHGFVGA